MSERDTYQLVLDESGRIIDVRRGRTPPGWSRVYPRWGATVWFTGRGVPRHACYDTPAEDHPLDAAFCRTARLVQHG